MDGSIEFSTTQSVQRYPESSFTFQINCILFFENRVNLFRKKCTFMNLKTKES